MSTVHFHLKRVGSWSALVCDLLRMSAHTEDDHPMLLQRLRTNSGSARSGKRQSHTCRVFFIPNYINRVMLMLDISVSSALGRPCAMTEERYVVFVFHHGVGI